MRSINATGDGGAGLPTAADAQRASMARLERDTLWVGLGATVCAFLAWPAEPTRALGVVAGVFLIALAYGGIRAGVDAAIGAVVPPQNVSAEARNRPAPRRSVLSRGFVKFFTRHAILAAGAYVMIARFELHPVAMLAGVTTPAVAAGIEFVRIVRARATGSHSRSS